MKRTLFGFCVVAAGLNVLAASGSQKAMPPAMDAYGPGYGGAIPDNDVIGFLTPIVVNDHFPIQSIGVRIVGLQHNYCSDLTIELRHPGVSSPTVLCTNIRFGNSADFDGDYNFIDTGADLWATCTGLSGTQDIPPGEYKASGSNGVPISLNAKYLNESSAGPWTLRIADDDFLVAGQFVQWELLLGGGPGCPQGIYGDLNGDRAVTIADITAVMSAFGNSCGN